ncbi:hypothetical protein [Streptomyces sp. MNU103]|uniref:hypothetical protein n=1 Tax=Streptomyces sp. MNU103 TaxID=2560024 RepID=UPI001E2E6FAE|nr:hypothetical protein [Streptomyces sp. MNU103]
MGRLTNLILSVTPGHGIAADAARRVDQEKRAAKKRAQEEAARKERARQQKLRLARKGSGARLF